MADYTFHPIRSKNDWGHLTFFVKGELVREDTYLVLWPDGTESHERIYYRPCVRRGDREDVQTQTLAVDVDVRGVKARINPVGNLQIAMTDGT